MEMYYIRGAWRTFDTRPRQRQCVLSHRSSSSGNRPVAQANNDEHAEHNIATGISSSKPDILVQSMIYTTRFREAKVFYRSFVSGNWIFESSSKVVLKCDTCHYVAVIDASQGGDRRAIAAQNVSHNMNSFLDLLVQLLIAIGHPICIFWAKIHDECLL